MQSIFNIPSVKSIITVKGRLCSLRLEPKSNPEIKKLDKFNAFINEDDIQKLISEDNKNKWVKYNEIDIFVPPYLSKNENCNLHLLTKTQAVLLPANSKYVSSPSFGTNEYIKDKQEITQNILDFLGGQENIIDFIKDGLLFIFHFKEKSDQDYQHSAYLENIPFALKKFSDPLNFYVMIYLMGAIGLVDDKLVKPIIEELIERIQLFDEKNLKKPNYIKENFNMLFPTIESFEIPSGVYETCFIFPNLITKISDINDKENLFAFLNV